MSQYMHAVRSSSSGPLSWLIHQAIRWLTDYVLLLIIHTGGIHAAELHGDGADPAADDGELVSRLDGGALERLFAKYGVAPTWTTRAFTW